MMLALGVVEVLHSKGRSLIVPKPDGTEHFCNDYRKANAILKFDVTQSQKVDELLEQLGAARRRSTLDLMQEHWQIL